MHVITTGSSIFLVHVRRRTHSCTNSRRMSHGLSIRVDDAAFRAVESMAETQSCDISMDGISCTDIVHALIQRGGLEEDVCNVLVCIHSMPCKRRMMVDIVTQLTTPVFNIDTIARRVAGNMADVSNVKTAIDRLTMRTMSSCRGRTRASRAFVDALRRHPPGHRIL